MDLSKITNIEIEGIDFKDAPDFCDTFIARADYKREPMTDEQLDNLSDENSDFVYESVINQIN